MSGPSETERNNIALLRRFCAEVWNDRRADKIDEFMSPDFITHHEHEEIRGPDRWKRQFYDAILSAIPDVRLEIEDIIASGDCVIARWRARGIQTGELLGVSPSGDTIELHGMMWTKIVDGRMTENWNNWNVSYLLRQLHLEVNRLREILPICASCKKIRDDKGYWHQVEVYVKDHTNTEFTHSICPDCAEKLYGV